MTQPSACQTSRNDGGENAGKIKQRNKTSEGEKKPKCGKTERDTGCSTEALVAQIPRMLSDSGHLMTGIRRHGESERAVAALQTSVPLSLGQSKQTVWPGLPCPQPPIQSIHPSIHWSQCLINTKTTKKIIIKISPNIKNLNGSRSCFECVCACVWQNIHVQTQQWHSSGFVFHTARQSEAQSGAVSVVLIRARWRRVTPVRNSIQTQWSCSYS